MRTFVRSMAQRQRLTSSAGDSHAPTSRSLGDRGESTGRSRVFGPSTHELLASFDPASRLWKTSQLSLETNGLAEFSETWPRAGMTRSGTAYRLRPLAPLTAGIGSGLLPTPNKRDWKNTGPSQGNRRSPNLGTVAHWPTPKASPSGPDYARMRRERSGGDDLATAVARSEPRGQLNPMWVEWLMGFPIGWTELPPSETQPCHRSRSGSDGAYASTTSGTDSSQAATNEGRTSKESRGDRA